MTYIDYSKSKFKKMGPMYPENEMKTGMDMISWIYHFLRVDYKWTHDMLEELRVKFANEMAKYPHQHYCSIIGPYCVVCHCNLPGPNGEWT